MRYERQTPVVLAVQPNTRGFGYAIFEAGTMPIDWGVKKTKADKNAESYEQIRILLHVYAPTTLVIEDHKAPSSRRSERIKKLLASIARLATRKGIKVTRYSPKEIGACFAPYDAKNKTDIARTIGQILPEFAALVPSPRKPWQSEGYQMGLFDAIALALTHHERQKYVV